MTTTTPDLFTNVHKGLRRALFTACTALGRAGEDERRGAAARSLLREVLHFTAHHGDNEDALLLPLLDAHAPAAGTRMRQAHGAIEEVLAALTAVVDTASTSELYARTCGFVSLYLDHMREEEQDLEPAILAAVPPADLATFGRRAVERTAPADQRMMLTWMLPAMTQSDADAFLARIPPALAEELRVSLLQIGPHRREGHEDRNTEQWH